VNPARARIRTWCLAQFIDDCTPGLRTFHQVDGFVIGARYCHGADFETVFAGSAFVQIDVARLLAQFYEKAPNFTVYAADAGIGPHGDVVVFGDFEQPGVHHVPGDGRWSAVAQEWG
jgi:hypothetical protein